MANLAGEAHFRSGSLTARRGAWLTGTALFGIYLATLAPGVTFWDAGELIAAAHSFGIPHPPGTPLFIALGRVWTLLLGPVLGVGRAMNVLSAVCTAAACALGAWMVSRLVGPKDTPTTTPLWGAVTGGMCAGLIATVWSNATETEVYAVALLHVALLLASAVRAGEELSDGGDRWLVCTAYLLALAPAVHLSVLVAAPAAVTLAARGRDDRWNSERAALLAGVMVSAAGVGRMSAMLVGSGALISLASLALGERANVRPQRDRVNRVLALEALAATALLIMLVRAHYDPAINQGNPHTLASLADVIARRQYDVAPLWPRRAPIWIQLAGIAQYADWQFALAWGRGVFTTPARLAVTILYIALGGIGWRALRRDSKCAGDAIAVLVMSGTIGVCAYLNLEAGASIGYGFVPAGAHEARERDYFFVLGMWGWALCAGYGAVDVLRSRRLPIALAFGVVLVPLGGNWRPADRARGARATAARDVALALVQSAPPRAVLFLAGDNDSYPVWYLQVVEGVRPDVTPVTMPLLPAAWYAAEVARRTGLRWTSLLYVPGAKWRHEEVAAAISRAARASGRPVAVSPQLSAHDRAFLGAEWRMEGIVYVSGAGPSPALGVTAGAGAFSRLRTGQATARRVAAHPDDVSMAMLALLDCARLAREPLGSSAWRDSLEVRCNLR